MDPAEVALLAVDPLSGDPCAEPNLSPNFITVFPALGISDPLDLRWDDYVAEWTLQDPNEIAQYRRFEFSFSLPPAPAMIDQPALLQLIVGWFERDDFDTDGQMEQLDGMILDVRLEPNDPGGVCTLRVNLDEIEPNQIGFMGYGAGLVMLDFGDMLLDPLTRLPLYPACGIGVPFAGGVPNEPACDPPEEFFRVGHGFAPPDNLLLAANATQGAGPGPPWDPNAPIPAADPLAPTYTEILNGGLLVQLDNGLAPDFPFLLAIDLSVCRGPCGCGFACLIGSSCADTNQDGAVDLTDLANVLSNFGAGGSVGDTDDDGDTDLTDLASVLARFGNVCP